MSTAAEKPAHETPSSSSGFMDDIRLAVSVVDPDELHDMSIGREPAGYTGRLTADELAEMIRLANSRLADLRAIREDDQARGVIDEATVPLTVGDTAIRGGDAPTTTLEMIRPDYGAAPVNAPVGHNPMIGLDPDATQVIPPVHPGDPDATVVIPIPGKYFPPGYS